MKTTKRLFSLLLALLMLLGLFPTAALAEEPGVDETLSVEPAEPVEDAAEQLPEDEIPESPAFLIQPLSGSHAPGETYVLTWALNLVPDRLELVREENAGDGVLDVPHDENGPAFILVRELDPASGSLEMTAPEEETVFYLRAVFGEEELLSLPFTVTEEPTVDLFSPERGGAEQSEAEAVSSPERGGAEQSEAEAVSSPERGGAEQSEAEGLEPLSPVETGTAPLAEEPEEPAGDGDLDVPSDDSDEPEAEPRPDEPQDDTHYFTVQPQDGTVAPEGYYRITWATNFTPTRVEIIHYTGYGGYKVLDTITSGLSTAMGYNLTYEMAFEENQANLLTDHGYGVWAYYSGSDKVLSDDFNVNVTPYSFTSNPSGGVINQGGTLQLSWRTNFRPLSIKIQYNYSQGWKLCYEMPYSQANIYSNSYTLNYSDAVTGYYTAVCAYLTATGR